MAIELVTALAYVIIVPIVMTLAIMTYMIFMFMEVVLTVIFLILRGVAAVSPRAAEALAAVATKYGKRIR